MNITYQDDVRCLSCWNNLSPRQKINHNQALFSNCPNKKTFQKISLKKHQGNSNKRKHLRNSTQLSPYINPLESTTNYSQDLSIPMKPRTVDNFLQPAQDHLRMKKSLSFKHKENMRNVIILDPIQHAIKVRQTFGTAKFIQPLQITQTVKISRQLQESQLSRTRKTIPRSQHNLFELSKMKNSAVSILGPEEKPRIEESTILIDFFSRGSQIGKKY